VIVCPYDPDPWNCIFLRIRIPEAIMLRNQRIRILSNVCHKIKILLWLSHSVILLLYHSVSHCNSVTLSICHSITLCQWHYVSLCNSVTLSICHSVILSLCHTGILSLLSNVLSDAIWRAKYKIIIYLSEDYLVSGRAFNHS